MSSLGSLPPLRENPCPPHPQALPRAVLPPGAPPPVRLSISALRLPSPKPSPSTSERCPPLPTGLSLPPVPSSTAAVSTHAPTVLWAVAALQGLPGGGTCPATAPPEGRSPRKTPVHSARETPPRSPQGWGPSRLYPGRQGPRQWAAVPRSSSWLGGWQSSWDELCSRRKCISEAVSSSAPGVRKPALGCQGGWGAPQRVKSLIQRQGGSSSLPLPSRTAEVEAGRPSPAGERAPDTCAQPGPAPAHPSRLPFPRLTFSFVGAGEAGTERTGGQAGPSSPPPLLPLVKVRAGPHPPGEAAAGVHHLFLIHSFTYAFMHSLHCPFLSNSGSHK